MGSTVLRLVVLLPVIGTVARRRTGLANRDPGNNVHSGEVATVMWLRLGPGRHRSAAQWIDRDGVRREQLPLPPTAAVAPHAAWRAPVSRSTHDGTERTLGANRRHSLETDRPRRAHDPDRGVAAP